MAQLAAARGARQRPATDLSITSGGGSSAGQLSAPNTPRSNITGNDSWVYPQRRAALTRAAVSAMAPTVWAEAGAGACFGRVSLGSVPMPVMRSTYSGTSMRGPVARVVPSTSHAQLDVNLANQGGGGQVDSTVTCAARNQGQANPHSPREAQGGRRIPSPLYRSLHRSADCVTASHAEGPSRAEWVGSGSCSVGASLQGMSLGSVGTDDEGEEGRLSDGHVAMGQLLLNKQTSPVPISLNPHQLGAWSGGGAGAQLGQEAAFTTAHPITLSQPPLTRAEAEATLAAACRAATTTTAALLDPVFDPVSAPGTALAAGDGRLTPLLLRPPQHSDEGGVDAPTAPAPSLPRVRKPDSGACGGAGDGDACDGVRDSGLRQTVCSLGIGPGAWGVACDTMAAGGTWGCGGQEGAPPTPAAGAASGPVHNGSSSIDSAQCLTLAANLVPGLTMLPRCSAVGGEGAEGREAVGGTSVSFRFELDGRRPAAIAAAAAAAPATPSAPALLPALTAAAHGKVLGPPAVGAAGPAVAAAAVEVGAPGVVVVAPRASCASNQLVEGLLGFSSGGGGWAGGRLPHSLLVTAPAGFMPASASRLGALLATPGTDSWGEDVASDFDSDQGGSGSAHPTDFDSEEGEVQFRWVWDVLDAG